VLWSIRPERVVIGDKDGLEGVFVDVADVGTAVDLFVSLSQTLEIQARVVGETSFEVGDPCRVALPPDAIALWPESREPSSDLSEFRR
jgi:hypothetical protein